MLIVQMEYGPKAKNATMETDSLGMVALCANETRTIIVLTNCCNPPSVISARKIVYSVV